MFVERVWGRRQLAPWYACEFDAPVGEAWLTGSECVVETGEHAGKKLRDVVGGEFRLLVKMLFPDEKLSVQVHPDDEQAAQLGGEARAKTECWYILAAEPGAAVALGIREGSHPDDVHAAAGGAEFEDLLEQVPVVAGDMIYVEAGTVHAIGGGMTLLEVQQASDTTFRLYDYGRPRELHLDEGLRVLKLETASGKVQPRAIARGQRLIGVEHFVVERFELDGSGAVAVEASDEASCLVGLRGACVALEGEESVAIACGSAVVVPGGSHGVTVGGAGVFLRCSLPG